jgi:hypothetical protein
MPFRAETSFYLLTIGSLAVAASLLVLYSRSLGFSSAESYAVMLLFLFSRWTTGYLLFDFALVDAPAFAFILLVLWLTETRANVWSIVAAIVIGVLAKEQVVFAAFYASYTLYQRRSEFKTDKLLAALPFAACIVVLLIARLAIRSVNDYSFFSESIRRFASVQPLGYLHYGVGETARFAFDASLATWGAVLPLFLFGLWSLRYARGPWLRGVLFVALVYCQLIIAWNTERVLIYAYPIVLTFAVASLSLTPGNPRRYSKPVLWGTVVLQAMVFAHSVLWMNGIRLMSLRDTLNSFLPR